MLEILLYILGGITTSWYFAVIAYLYHGLIMITKSYSSNGNKFSIVIAARNEAENIRICLETVFAQSVEPSRFEVIVVNDRSTDATRNIVEALQVQYPSLKCITIDKIHHGFSPKKYAISRGIAEAQNDIIVLTDADCRVPTEWLETLDSYFTSDVGLVQGITTYFFIPGVNRLFFNLQALDFISHGIVSAAAIGAKLPINSNANNFAFRKAAYIEAGGITEEIGHVVSGDDDLLLQKIWKRQKWNIKFMAETSAAVETMPSRSIRTVFQQRARWGSKTVHYDKSQVLLLSGVFIFYVVIAGFIVYTFIDISTFRYPVIMLFCKFLGECLLMVPGLKMFKKLQLFPLLPLASIVQLPLVIGAIIVGVFGKFTWKGQSFSRTVKKYQ